VEILVFGLLLVGAVAIFVVSANLIRRPPSAVESFNQMAEEAMQTRSRLEWALRIGMIIGVGALMMIFTSLSNDGKLLPPADVIYPAVAIAGGLCGLALWFWFLRHKKRR
jgi:hypothetical protein